MKIFLPLLGELKKKEIIEEENNSLKTIKKRNRIIALFKNKNKFEFTFTVLDYGFSEFAMKRKILQKALRKHHRSVPSPSLGESG